MKCCLLIWKFRSNLFSQINRFNDMVIFTLLPNKNVNVTVVVNCVCINKTKYNKSGFVGNGLCKNILKNRKCPIMGHPFNLQGGGGAMGYFSESNFFFFQKYFLYKAKSAFIIIISAHVRDRNVFSLHLLTIFFSLQIP